MTKRAQDPALMQAIAEYQRALERLRRLAPEMVRAFRQPHGGKLHAAAAALGRKGGSKSSPAKAKAARKNARRRWQLHAAKTEAK